MLDAFGPGAIVATRTDVANATPINIGFAQSFNLEFSGNLKELYGQNQFPIDVARGTVKVTGKLHAAVISGIAWNNMFFGASMVTGSLNWASPENQTVPTTPFQITASQAANFDKDLGVINNVTGLPLTRVASGPTTGQYSVNESTGVYTFAAADTGISMALNYAYTTTAGQTLPIVQTLLGFSPIFQLDYLTTRNNKAFLVRMNQCQASKISMATKLEDFVMPEIDLGCFANAAGNIGKIYFPEVS